MYIVKIDINPQLIGHGELANLIADALIQHNCPGSVKVEWSDTEDW